MQNCLGEFPQWSNLRNQFSHFAILALSGPLLLCQHHYCINSCGRSSFITCRSAKSSCCVIARDQRSGEYDQSITAIIPAWETVPPKQRLPLTLCLFLPHNSPTHRWIEHLPGFVCLSPPFAFISPLIDCCVCSPPLLCFIIQGETLPRSPAKL